MNINKYSVIYLNCHNLLLFPTEFRLPKSDAMFNRLNFFYGLKLQGLELIQKHKLYEMK